MGEPMCIQCINNLGHMTKMAVMPIYGKNPSNFFSETNRLISMKLGVKHPWLKYKNVYINHDTVITLTKFMARSTWVAHALEWEKVLKCHLKGKASKKLANGQNIDYSEKRKRPKGFICPCTGVKYHNIQTCLLIYAADSGERLQDHWSSGVENSSHKPAQTLRKHAHVIYRLFLSCKKFKFSVESF